MPGLPGHCCLVSAEGKAGRHTDSSCNCGISLCSINGRLLDRRIRSKREKKNTVRFTRTVIGPADPCGQVDRGKRNTGAGFHSPAYCLRSRSGVADLEETVGNSPEMITVRICAILDVISTTVNIISGLNSKILWRNASRNTKYKINPGGNGDKQLKSKICEFNGIHNTVDIRIKNNKKFLMNLIDSLDNPG